jgi:prolyl-tRNA editing enzyme YbaK/EbsC (Cys-tRNA(Pro) deacylase)
MTRLDTEPVRRVRDALAEKGLGERVVELDETARSAKDAAKALDCELGQIVKSLVFAIDRRIVMALVAGDRRCLEQNLPPVFFLKGTVRRPEAGEVKAATGFSIGGVAPVGLAQPLPIAIDRSLKRFDTLYAAAGHPHCVFPVSVPELKRLTGGIVSYNISEPLEDAG